MTSTDADPAPPRGPTWASRLRDLGREGDTFVATAPAGSQGRLFGGLVAGHALAAACATVDEEKLPQSLHAYFVRAGRPRVDVRYEVERTRDGRSFDTRRVTARQGDEVIFEMLASFHRPEPGTDWHPPAPPIAPLADTTPLPVPAELSDHFDIRTPGEAGMFVGPPYWIRSHEPVADDPVTRACALAFVSDIALMAAARPPGTPFRFGSGFAASLDHSVWLHRPFHPDRWHRYQAGPVNGSDARGLAFGGLYDEGGTLVATMAQEALWRTGS